MPFFSALKRAKLLRKWIVVFSELIIVKAPVSKRYKWYCGEISFRAAFVQDVIGTARDNYPLYIEGENPRGTRAVRARWGSRFPWTYGQPVPHRDKKALQKRRQKLGVSAGDISGLKLSRRSKHVLPVWFCAPCPIGWMAGRSVGRSLGSLTGARMAFRPTGVLALVNSLDAIPGTR